MKTRSPMGFDVVAYATDEKAILWTMEEHGGFSLLLQHAWINGSIPPEISKLSKICRCSEADMNRVWPQIKNSWKLSKRTGRLTNPKQEKERKFIKEKEKMARESAKRRWEKERADAMRTHSVGNATQQCERNASPLSSSHLLSNKNKSSPASAGRAVDLAYEHFAEGHRKKHGFEYQPKKADFVQLTILRRAFGLEGKETPGKWEIACSNYWESVVRKVSLADLCARYAVFVDSALDRFGGPVAVEVNGLTRVGENKDTQAAIQRTLTLEQEQAKFREQFERDQKGKAS